MNRLVFIMGLFLVLVMPQAWGYPNPNRQTMWNNFTDGVHTLGQNPRQAALTKRRLHHVRTLQRVHDINHAKQQAWLNSHN